MSLQSISSSFFCEKKQLERDKKNQLFPHYLLPQGLIIPLSFNTKQLEKFQTKHVKHATYLLNNFILGFILLMCNKTLLCGISYLLKRFYVTVHE